MGAGSKLSNQGLSLLFISNKKACEPSKHDKEALFPYISLKIAVVTRFGKKGSRELIAFLRKISDAGILIFSTW